MEKMASDGPNWWQENLFPTDPDLADILGDTDFDFEIEFSKQSAMLARSRHCCQQTARTAARVVSFMTYTKYLFLHLGWIAARAQTG